MGLARSPWTGPWPFLRPSLPSCPGPQLRPGGSFSVSGRELSGEQDEPHPAEGLDRGFMAQQHFISSFLPCSQVDKIVTCSTYKKLLSGEGGCPRPHRTGTRTKSLNPSATPAGPPSLSRKRPGAQVAPPQEVGMAVWVLSLELQERSLLPLALTPRGAGTYCGS